MRAMRLPFTRIVEVVGSLAWRACLLNVPATFIRLTIDPPVIRVVSVYWKSAKREVGTTRQNATRIASRYRVLTEASVARFAAVFGIVNSGAGLPLNRALAETKCS